MDSKEIKEQLGKPLVSKFLDTKSGLRVKEVLGRRCLVRTVKPETELDNAKKMGLVIPDHIEKANVPPPSTGVVIQIGPPVEKIEVGDMVLFSQFAGSNFLINREEYKILDEEEIWAILEEVGEQE